MSAVQNFSIFIRVIQCEVDNIIPGKASRKHNYNNRENNAHSKYGNKHAYGYKHFLPKWRHRGQHSSVNYGVIETKGYFNNHEHKRYKSGGGAQVHKYQ